MSTEEDLGYHDAMRQVIKCMQRRLKTLQDERKTASPQELSGLDARIAEVVHLIQVVESLHR